MFISVLGASPYFAAAAGQDKPEGAIHAEWPEMDFTAAYDDFTKGDFAAASQEIKKGSDFLKAASKRSEGKIKKDLLRSYSELKKLSVDIEKGAVKSSARLRKVFSRAHQALAEYYHARLKNSWLKKDTERAAKELNSTASNLERGISWAGGAVEEKTKKVITEARSLGKRLAKKAQWSAEEVEKRIKEFGEELKKLEDKVVQGQKGNTE